MLRVIENLVSETGFHHVALMHDDEPVGEQARHGEIVRDQDDGESHGSDETAQQVEPRRACTETSSPPVGSSM